MLNLPAICPVSVLLFHLYLSIMAAIRDCSLGDFSPTKEPENEVALRLRNPPLSSIYDPVKLSCSFPSPGGSRSVICKTDPHLEPDKTESDEEFLHSIYKKRNEILDYVLKRLYPNKAKRASRSEAEKSAIKITEDQAEKYLRRLGINKGDPRYSLMLPEP